MKYGVLYNKNNINIGDDIQTYATALFLPTVDYFVDREHIDEFVTEDKKACAVIMNAWYMWAKWNWPPSKYIYPHFVGFHYADHQLAKQMGTPVKFEFLQGKGGEYLKAYSPIGCRDKFTEGKLQELGIDSYFTGCITLTLPKQRETADKGSYICLVDVDERVKNKIHEDLKDEDIEIREICHNRERDPDMPWEKRLDIVKDLLTVYQNARCVVTKRLHCALPCLAMGVPVLLVKGMKNDIRFDPYYDFLHYSGVFEYLEGRCDYDLLNPPANKEDYLQVRESLIKSCEEFVEKTKNVNDDPDELDKTKGFYTPEEVVQWRNDTMKKVMDNWYFDRREKMTESIRRKRKIDELQGKLKKIKEDKKVLKEKYDKRKEKIDALTEKKNKFAGENKELKKEIKKIKKQLEIEKNRSLSYILKKKIKNRLKRFKK